MKKCKSSDDSDTEVKAIADVHLSMEELYKHVDHLKAVTDQLVDRLGCVTTDKGPAETDTVGITATASNCDLSTSIRSEGSRVLGVARLLETQIETLEI